MSDDARLAVIIEAKIDKLTEKLNAATRGIYGATTKWQRDLDKMNSSWERLFSKADPVKALDKIIDSTRLKVLDSGIAKVGLLGSAFEALGPEGLLAAAGIAAVAAAYAGTRDAARFADDINDTATRLHVTTDALQEYREATRLAGGDTKGADEALESFSSALGKAEAGLPKALRAFRELFGKGFTKEDVRQLGGVEQAIDKISEAIKGLPTEQQDAVIDQLGLSGMKTVLEDNERSIAQQKQDVRDLGLVMDANLIRKGGEANDKFETMEKVISIQLKSALLDLAPAMTALLGLAAELAAEFGDVVAAFQKVENRTTHALERKRDQLQDSIAGSQSSAWLPGGKEYIARLQGKLDKVNSELARRAAEAAASAPAAPKPTKNLFDTNKASGPSAEQLARQELERRARYVDAMAQADERELQAEESASNSASERARIENALVEYARQKRQRDLDQRQDEYALSKGRRGLSAAERRELDAKNAAADEEEDRARDLRQHRAIQDEAMRVAREQIEGDLSILGIHADLARTIGARYEIELARLNLSRELERREREVALKRDPALSDAQRQARLAQFDEETRLQRQQLRQNNLGPIADWIDKAPQSIDELNEAFQRLDVQGLDQLNSGLAEAIVEAQNLGDVGKAVFRQLAIELLKMELQAGEAKLLKVLGFATGGWVAGPGGPRGDKIPAMLSDGEFVVNAAASSRHRALLEAINSGRVPHLAAGGLVGSSVLSAIASLPSPIRLAAPPTQIIQYHLKSPVVTEDLLRQMQSMADTARVQATVAGGELGASKAIGRISQRGQRKLGLR